MRVLTAGVVLVAAMSSGATALAAAPSTGQVVIVHGVRGLVANVDVDGSRALSAFQPERTTDPLQLAAGTHSVVVRRANDPSAAPVLQKTVTVPAGGLVSAALGLGATGQPSVTLFNERGPAVPAGKARLVVRHIAAAPMVQTTLDGHSLGAALSGGSRQTTADLAAGKHSLGVVGMDGAPVLAPQDLPLRAGTVTTVYLIGSVPENTLTWLVRISDTRALAGVPTGTDGLAATGASIPWSGVALVMGIVLLLPVLLLRARRRG